MQVCKVAFGAAKAGDVFQKKIDNIFKELSNVLSIADNNLVEGCDENSADHERTVCRSLQICRKENPNSTKKNTTLSAPVYLSLGKLFPDMVSNWIHKKLHMLTEMLTKEL